MDLPDFIKVRIDADEQTLADHREWRLREEAHEYSDHPDYQQEWAP